jgi:hypothetical protein
MASKPIEYPRLHLPMGKSKMQVIVTVWGNEQAHVEFSAYKVRGKLYSGIVDLKMREGRFTSSAFDHRCSMFPTGQGLDYKAVTSATRNAICSDAEALVNELRKAKPEVFLDAEIIAARISLTIEERNRNDIQAKLVEADEKCAACVRAIKAAIQRRKAYRKK